MREGEQIVDSTGRLTLTNGLRYFDPRGQSRFTTLCGAGAGTANDGDVQATARPSNGKTARRSRPTMCCSPGSVKSPDNQASNHF